MLLVSILAGCGPAAAPPSGGDVAGPASAGATGYVAPPELAGADRGVGGLLLRGFAAPGAEVLLASPDGPAPETVAGPDGRWSVALPDPSTPRLFSLAARMGERVVRAEGTVVILPDPGPTALMARAGFAALPLEVAGLRPTIAAVDYDAQYGAAVAGLAAPRARVRLSVDGAVAGLGQADARGRYAVMASNRPLAPGLRRLEVETDAGRAEATVAVSPPAPLGRAAYRAERQPGGWRIDWAPPGGGIQTTVVLDLMTEPAK